jgi:hypothetical protein
MTIKVSVKATAEGLAAADGRSINQFPVMAAAEKPASIQTAETYFAGMRGRGNRDEALAFLTRSGGQAPRAGDEMDGD